MENGNLVLSRKIGQQVIIGKNMIVEVTDINKNGQVRLRFIVPKHIPVNRVEVLKKNHKTIL